MYIYRLYLYIYFIYKSILITFAFIYLSVTTDITHHKYKWL